MWGPHSMPRNIPFLTRRHQFYDLTELNFVLKMIVVQYALINFCVVNMNRFDPMGVSQVLAKGGFEKFKAILIKYF